MLLRRDVEWPDRTVQIYSTDKRLWRNVTPTRAGHGSFAATGVWGGVAQLAARSGTPLPPSAAVNCASTWSSDPAVLSSISVDPS